MTWSEMKKTDSIVDDVKAYIVERMAACYPSTAVDGKLIFTLSDGMFMSVFAMHGDGFDCLGMEYGEQPNLLPDDGDLYYPDDYQTPDDMFTAMLAETKL